MNKDYKFKKCKFEQPKFEQPQFTQPEFIQPEFIQPEFDYPYQETFETKGAKNSVKRFTEDFSIYDISDTLYEKGCDISDSMYEWCCDKKDTIEEIYIDYSVKPVCDKYDYMVAALVGCATGLVDVFFIGSPGNSIMEKPTHYAVDRTVIQFSQMVYEADKRAGCISKYKKKPCNITGAIAFLEARFKVSYDARYGKDLIGGEVLSGFNSCTPHFKSLAHSPDIVGLFFSILDQFTNKTTVVNSGNILRLEPVQEHVIVYGDNPVAKIVAGFINWLGHVMSDLAGSSGTRVNQEKTGMGVSIPFFELLQFSNIEVNKEIGNIASLAEKMFMAGYEARFGITMAIPVFLNDVFTKIAWAFRERYYCKREWLNIYSSMKNDRRLARMDLVSAGCFSLIDVTDAAVRGYIDHSLLTFALHVNYTGLCRFALTGYREIRLAIGNVDREKLNDFVEHELKRCEE